MQRVPAGSGDISVGDADRPSLAIGCFAAICRDRLADELLTFSRICPQVDIGVHEMPRGGLLPALRAGQLALAVLPGKEEPGLCSIELWRGRVMAAMPAHHPLTRGTFVSVAALREETMLVSRQQIGSDMHRFLAGRILPLGPALSATILDLGPPRILQRVARGDGLALVCEGHVGLLDTGVVVRPVEAPGAVFPVRAYWPDIDPPWPVSALIGSLTALATGD
ncbi:LysR family substrate-binding domain-containing protein [Sphingomonas panacisoli]|nr:LysR family substrate-binding domain-containing protein [Sphingomonas panacisoli]